MAKFNFMKIMPGVKELYAYPDSPTVTLGDMSYISEGDVENLVGEGPHILIGKFAEIALGERFLCGQGKDYKSTMNFILDARGYGAQFYTECPILPPPVNFPTRMANYDQVIIGNDVWIGSHATILAGYRIGNGAVIGANAVVAKDVPPYAIAVGNPARVVKYRFKPETIRKLQAIRWWNWDLEKIYENLQLMVDDADEFANRFYSPEIEECPPDELGNLVRELKSHGIRIFTSILDLGMKKPLWKKIAEDFATNDIKNSVLIFHSMDEEMSREQFQSIADFVEDLSPNIIVTKFSKDALLETDVLVTTKAFNSLIAIDLLNGKIFKTWYAYDPISLA